MPRRFHPFRRFLAAAITSSLLIACDSSSNGPAPQTARAKIFTSNYPLAYFAQQISGDPELVYFPKIDGDPAFWSPTAGDITRVQQCDPLIINGATYEKWRATVTLPTSRIIDTTASFQDQLINITDVITHQHGPDGDHSHSGTAFTTWIDFAQAIEQARTIKTGLQNSAIVPPATLEKNLTSLTQDLSKLDKDLRSLTSKKTDLTLLASHPIYQYFARAYHLDIHSVLWEPEIYPDEEQWQALEKALNSQPAKWMLWEGPPLEKSVQRLSTMGISSIVFDPCANTPDTGNFLSVMKQNIENLRPVFSP